MNFGIAQAGKLVLLPRFEVHMALKELDKEKPSFFPGVPRLFVALNEAPETREVRPEVGEGLHLGRGAAPARGRGEVPPGDRRRQPRGGVRAHRDVAGDAREPVRRAEARDHRSADPRHRLPDRLARGSGQRGAAGRARRALHQGTAGHARVLEQARGHGRDDPGRTGCTPATSRSWTTRGSSRSSTG